MKIQIAIKGNKKKLINGFKDACILLVNDKTVVVWPAYALCMLNIVTYNMAVTNNYEK